MASLLLLIGFPYLRSVRVCHQLTAVHSFPLFQVSPIVKFDVSGHPEARTHVAKELLKRLDNDMGKYAEMANNAVEPKVRGMLDADLARYARLDKEIPEPDAKIEAEVGGRCWR